MRVRGSPIRAVNVCWTRQVHAVLCKDRFLFCIQVHSSIYTWPYVHINIPHRVLAGMNVNKLYIYIAIWGLLHLCLYQVNQSPVGSAAGQRPS